jgi:hypothetical protein
VSLRALPADSPAYFFEMAFGKTIPDLVVERAAASAPHSALRNTFHVAPPKVPFAFAA